MKADEYELRSIALSAAEQTADEEFRQQAGRGYNVDDDDMTHEDPNDCDMFEITNGIC